MTVAWTEVWGRVPECIVKTRRQNGWGGLAWKNGKELRVSSAMKAPNVCVGSKWMRKNSSQGMQFKNSKNISMKEQCQSMAQINRVCEWLQWRSNRMRSETLTISKTVAEAQEYYTKANDMENYSTKEYILKIQIVEYWAILTIAMKSSWKYRVKGWFKLVFGGTKIDIPKLINNNIGC